MSNPFLSVIVPCYNSKKLKRLLNSVVECNMTDIEVILVDDCSTESYQDDIDEFKDKLNIIQKKLDYNCGSPSNGREAGAQIATGTYLTFVDHDDSLIPEGVQQLREFVESNDYPEYVVAGIRQVSDETGDTEVEKYEILPFLHGKFFHREKFYKKCDLHHKKDLEYQEDNWLTSYIACSMIKYNIAPTFVYFCTYNWTNNPMSLSKGRYEKQKKDRVLNRKMIEVNILITYETMFPFFDEGSLPEPVACEWFIRSILQMYFDSQLYYQFFEDYVELVPPFLRDIKSRLQFTNRDIMDFSFCDNARVFRDELNNIVQFHQDDWEAHLRVEQFLELCDPDSSLQN